LKVLIADDDRVRVRMISNYLKKGDLTRLLLRRRYSDLPGPWRHRLVLPERTPVDVQEFIGQEKKDESARGGRRALSKTLV